MIYSIIGVLFSSTNLTILFLLSVIYAVAVVIVTSDPKRFREFQADIHNSASLMSIVAAGLIVGAFAELAFLVLFTKALIMAGILVNTWISALIVLIISISCNLAGIYLARFIPRISWIPITIGVSTCMVGFCVFFTVF
jgi:flagellar biosynthesis protein FlhB